MYKFLKNILVFIIVFGIVIAINNDSEEIYGVEADTKNAIILDTIDNLRFYSSFNYQTLTEEKLDQIIVDFYLPTSYGDVLIDWSIESEFLQLDDEVTTIEIQSVAGTVFIDCLEVEILSQPNAFQGNQIFELAGNFIYMGETVSYSYFGELSPSMPDGFFGGVIFTLVRYLSLFVEGALYTLGISLTGTILGFVLALFIALGKTLKVDESDSKGTRFMKKSLHKISSFYVIVFRGTPMIVQASFFWYGFGLFGDALLCGLFVVSLNTAAYIAEIIRGGIQSIDDGQTEASKSLGMTHSQTMRYIIFPQAIKNSLPAIGNEFIINIKDTAVLSVIGIFELFNQAKRIAGMHYRQLEAYLVVALIYLFLTYTVSSILRYVEKRMDMPLKELPSSN